MYPEIDFVIRGEGEETLLDLVQTLHQNKPLSSVQGLSFRDNGKIIENSLRPLMENLDDLPLPGYHLIEEHIKNIILNDGFVKGRLCHGGSIPRMCSSLYILFAMGTLGR